MKSVRYDRHARRRMKERGVTEGEADTVIKEPDYVEQSVKGRTNAYKFIGGRFLRVTFKEESENILVVTVAIRKKSFR